MGLRDYQEEACAAIRNALARNVWSQIVVLPTGAGKTVLFAHLQQALADWLAPYPWRKQKMLVIAHREELLDQAKDKIQFYNRDLRIGIEQGARRAAPMDDVVIASIQTLAARNGARLARLNPDDFRIVVVDEAHHAAADSYQDVLRYFGLVPTWPDRTGQDETELRAAYRTWWDTPPTADKLLLGVTATPARGDAIGLEWTFRELVYEKTLRWMIQRDYLVPLVGYVVETEISLDTVRKVAGDFNVGQLARVVNTPERNQQAVAAWRDYAWNRRTIAFCVDIQHAKDLAAAFNAVGIVADWVSGEDADRDRKVQRLRDGDLDVICNCNVLTEGFDEPGVSAILHCRPTNSPTLYMQMTGRGTRKADGKADCVVIDMVDIARRHALVTAGDLFGLPKRWNALGRSLEAQAAAVDAIQMAFPDVPLIEGLTLDALQATVKRIDLWAIRDSETAGKYARLRWVEESPDRFHVALPARTETGALESVTQGRLEIRRALLGGWDVFVIGTARESLGSVDDIGLAFDRAERWVKATRPDAWAMKQKDAAWRDRAASEKQVALLRRLRAPMGDGLTRGQASDMLDKYYARRGRTA